MLKKIIGFSWLPLYVGTAYAESMDSGIVDDPLIPPQYGKYVPLVLLLVLVYFVFFHKKRK